MNLIRMLRPCILFFGASTFAWRFADTLHESGHALADLLWSADSASFLGGLSAACSPLLCDAIESVAVVLFDLLIAVTIGLLLWRKRSPGLLPFLLMGSYSLLFESQYMIAQAFVYPQEYADWTYVMQVGVPSVIVGLLGVALLILGCLWLLLLLPLTGIRSQDAFLRKLVVLLSGIPLYFLVAGFFQVLFLGGVRGDFIQGLVISSVLMTIIAALHKMTFPWLDRIWHTPTAEIRWRDALAAMGLGLMSVIIQMVFFDDPAIW